MTMLDRVSSFNNEYFNSLIREYTDKKQRPENFGMSRAIMAYLDTNDSGATEFMVNDMPFLQDMDGFMEAVGAAGITEFLLCDTSTALMESLHYLRGHGWMVGGACEVKVSHFSTRQGLRMKKA